MLKNKKIFLPPLTLAAIMLIISGWSLATYLILLTKQKFVYTGLLLYIVKGGFALSVIVGKRVRSAEGMWVFFILTLPTLAIPIYLISARSSHAIREKALIKNADAQKPRHESFEDKMLPKCNQSFAFLSDIASNPNVSVYTSTKAKYYAESSEMLHSLYDDLNGARQFIFLEFYTVAAGEVFGKVCDILKKKASEGVEIRILYDAIGSLFKVPENLPQIMRSIGVEARACFSLFSSFPGGINNRNHRKIAIIDGEIAYTGGINLADEYIYSRPKMGKWKDAGVRIRGEGVVALTHTFLSDFVFSGGSCPDFLKYYKCKRQSENS
ncbi:MAG: hypothetical protein IKV16_04600, partial [Clostridia bacterium]|nr:hypothetical protein [Clostridia bacterium]